MSAGDPDDPLGRARPQQPALSESEPTGRIQKFARRPAAGEQLGLQRRASPAVQHCRPWGRPREQGGGLPSAARWNESPALEAQRGGSAAPTVGGRGSAAQARCLSPFAHERKFKLHKLVSNQ